MFTKLFWKDAFERAVSTAAQAFLAIVGVGLFNVMQFDWPTALAITGGAALLAVLKALAAGTVSNAVSPASFMPADPDLPAVAKEDVEKVLGNAQPLDPDRPRHEL